MSAATTVVALFYFLGAIEVGEEYLYNAKTDTLHIRGYCWHTRRPRLDYIPFATEDEAIAYDGRAVGMCKLCQKRREQLIKTRNEV